jgi:acyl carrier protein
VVCKEVVDRYIPATKGHRDLSPPPQLDGHDRTGAAAPRGSANKRVGRGMDETDQKVIEIVSEQMGVDKSEITRETHFINDLNADSLDTVELVMEFEDEFELSIPDEEAEKIQTVGQAIDYIKEHQNK